VGINHEQQHQELILTDIKHALWSQPLQPAYQSRTAERRCSSGVEWIDYPGGIHRIGFSGDGFCFDNETPRHDVLLQPYRLQSRLVTNAEFMTFINDGGYRTPSLWLSEGWDTVLREGWQAPLYWEQRDGGWHQFTLAGWQPVDSDAPVSHVSYFEADAYAHWARARLPLESEWEVAAAALSPEGNFVESGHLHPIPETASAGGTPHQMFGDVWEWTASPYTAYPGFKPAEGALGEYNGKFMCNQYVLRGGSCATPQSHIRASYRNFFPAHARWQFTGIRLAADAG
ncbi:MAG TPA: ergothioneine biosynthesis protein EgtB, partial [Terriglobales bacterium]